MLMNLWFDLKYAWRLAVETPGYSALSVIVVALSVGLALFSYVIDYCIALKPLPFAGSDRWISVQIASKANDEAHPRLDAYTYQELVRRTPAVHNLGAFARREAVLSEGQASSSLRAADISPSLLGAMQSPPRMGRLFADTDSQPGATPVVILSYDTWQNYFAADPQIIGKQTRVDGRPVQIVGVMPETFFAFHDFQLWMPLQLPGLAKPGDSAVTLAPLVALQNGQDMTTVLQSMQPVIADINRVYPDLFDAGRHVELFPAHLMSSHGDVQVLQMATFIAIAVLLLGCVNIGMIFFARLLERSRELALRRALGSSRARLLGQCLLESVFVILVGLAVGVVLAALAVQWASGLLDFTARVQALGRGPNDLVLQPGDLIAAVAAAAVIWLVSTLIPAWRISRQDPAVVLAGSGKGSATSGGRFITSSVLVGVQVALSSLLLVICGNLVTAVNQELSKPIGIDSNAVVASTYPTVFGSRYAAASERLRYWDNLGAAVRERIPGAQVAYATAVPTDPANVPVAIDHRESDSNKGALSIPVTAISENYLEMLGVKLRSGRVFDSTDNETSQPAVIVDESMAARYWPGQDAVGKRIQLNPGQKNAAWLTVVGVVSRVSGPYSEDPGLIYQPLRQAVPSEFELLVKLPDGTANGAASLIAAAYATDRDLPLHNLQMLGDVLDALNGYRSMVPGFSGIATIILILAATGLFGLISRSVARRTQEVGIRRALGGTRWQVTAVFLRQGLLYLGIGIVGGCLGILVVDLMTDSIPNVLTGVVPVTIGVFALMACVIFVASYLPTRHAVALDPGDALRYE